MELTAASIDSDLNRGKYEDWLILDQRITALISAGALRRVNPLRMVHLPSEEWYLEPSGGDMYVYVRPDDRVSPQWEKVDIFASIARTEIKSRDVRVAGLKIITTGNIRVETALFLQAMLGKLTKEGRLEVVFQSQVQGEASETWYRELATGSVYRLVQGSGATPSSWNLAPSTVEAQILQ